MKATRAQTTRYLLSCFGGFAFGLLMLCQVWLGLTEGIVFDIYIEDTPIEFYVTAITCAVAGSFITKFSADGLRLVLQGKHHDRARQVIKQLEDKNVAPSGLRPLWIGLILFAVCFLLFEM